MTHESDTDGFGRRGALAALLGTAAVAAAAGPAGAAPVSNVRKSLPFDAPSASPITETIASPAVTGFIYRTLWYGDFLPLDPSASARTFGGSGGAYGATVLEAAVEIPAGALLRNAEWYVANTSGSASTFYCAIWTPADGYISLFAPVSIPSGTGLTATEVLVPESAWGPYPHGSKIILYAPTSSTVLLNGVRLGFSGGGLEASMPLAPTSIYNSAVSGGIFTAGQTRIIGIGGVVPGTTAAIIRVVTTGSTANGTVKIYPADQGEPSVGSAMILGNSEAVGEMTVRVNAGRHIKVKPSRACHVRLDLVGWLR